MVVRKHTKNEASMISAGARERPLADRHREPGDRVARLKAATAGSNAMLAHLGGRAPLVNSLLFSPYRFFTPWQNLGRPLAFVPLCSVDRNEGSW